MQVKAPFNPRDWELLQNGIDDRNINEEEVTRLCKKIFEAVDTDGSGLLDTTKIQAMAYSLEHYRGTDGTGKGLNVYPILLTYINPLALTRVHFTIEDIRSRMSGTKDDDKTIPYEMFLKTSLFKMNEPPRPWSC